MNWVRYKYQRTGRKILLKKTGSKILSEGFSGEINAIIPNGRSSRRPGNR
jgi:hypothetical protein